MEAILETSLLRQAHKLWTDVKQRAKLAVVGSTCSRLRKSKEVVEEITAAQVKDAIDSDLSDFPRFSEQWPIETMKTPPPSYAFPSLPDGCRYVQMDPPAESMPSSMWTSFAPTCPSTSSNSFAGEGPSIFYIVKAKDEVDDTIFHYSLTQHLTYHPSHFLTLALIKRSPTLDSTVPIATQLHVLNLFGREETPYESLHAVVSNGVKPWFDAFEGTWNGYSIDEKEICRTGTVVATSPTKRRNSRDPSRHSSCNTESNRSCQCRRCSSQPFLHPPKTLSDSSFLNSLHAHVNSWIKSIQSITKLTHDISFSTASQEINFWLSLECALENIETQLRSEAVTMVMDCLKNAKRFHATVTTDLVHKYNQLMKDFPLNELLSATDLDKIQESLILIFSHLTRKLRLSPYPIRRALPLVKAILCDFNDILLRILTSARLAYIPYKMFKTLLSQTTNIFRVWDDQIKEFTNVAREVTRKRSERFIPIKVVPAHAKLQERIRYLREWRKQHEQLAVMTAPTKGLGLGLGLSSSDLDLHSKVLAAYELVKRIDVLDVSVEGTEIWDRLGSARNAGEIGAIQEYQTQLIDLVKEDIKHLHDKFKTQYRSSSSYHMSLMRDLPPISGAILWARQIDRQLLTYMKRIEDVLGVYKAWLTDIQRCNMGVEGQLFEIIHFCSADSPSDATSTNVYQLAINFDLQTITLFKETCNLLWLGFSIPHSIMSMAKDAKCVYPHAVSLMETVHTYGQTLALIKREQQLDSEPGIESLMTEWRSETQKMISKGINIKWDYFVNQYDTGGRFGGSGAMDGKDNRHVQFVREFAGVVSVLQDKTNSCISLYSSILHSIADLSTCSYTTDAFSSHLKKIQGAIDRLNLEGYSNLDWWVAELDKRIKKILLGRLENVIEVWCNEFQKTAEGDEGLALGSLKKRHGQGAGQRGVGSKEDKFMETHMTIKPFVHEIRIQNQVIFLDPPIEHTLAAWIKQLHDRLGIVCHLHCIQSSRYEIGLQMQSSVAGKSNYTSLLVQLPPSTLQLAFSLIECKVSQLHSYILKWFQFQSLWDQLIRLSADASAVQHLALTYQKWLFPEPATQDAYSATAHPAGGCFAKNVDK
ncbi:hypothetical protein GYMLUDRAFT_253036 [Collybiopsis luxurians FD-317 M1]|uniref:Dynein heavy chain tail domain-containing protein n=1 Tax=Collybiopsis luxurians FD-317 M1 TaxID=944289 RepID=A0A0D0BYA8_9AGAR|nr:hypothetical protein GYMLUDRAFT_253036 [Collybiopsis luxurians FD-317 M1]